MFQHKGFEIDIDDNGRFSATVGDMKISAKSLEEVKQGIDKEVAESTKERHKLALKIVGTVGTYRDDLEISRGVVTGINRTSRELQIDPTPKGKEWKSVLPDTPENEELLRKIARLRVEMDLLNSAATERAIGVERLGSRYYGRIDAATYPVVVKAISEQYSKSVKLGEVK